MYQIYHRNKKEESILFKNSIDPVHEDIKGETENNDRYSEMMEITDLIEKDKKVLKNGSPETKRNFLSELDSNLKNYQVPKGLNEKKWTSKPTFFYCAPRASIFELSTSKPNNR